MSVRCRSRSSPCLLTRLCLVLATTVGMTLAGSVVVMPLPARADTSTLVEVPDPVTVQAPRLVRSIGPELRWTRFTGTTTFDRYDVHRSRTTGFTPSAATLLTSIRDQNITAWQDTTAAASSTFYYKVVVALVQSNQLTVTTPAAGTAKLTLDGDSTYIQTDRVAPAGCAAAANNGAMTTLKTGPSIGGWLYRSLLRFDVSAVPAAATVTAATMELSYPATAHSGRSIDLYRVDRPWVEGTGLAACDGSGATWTEAKSGTAWTTSGSDATRVGPSFGFREFLNVEGVDVVDVVGTVRQWTSGAVPNHGFMLRYIDESEPGTLPPGGAPSGLSPDGGTGIQSLPNGSYYSHYSDDATDATKRPRLLLTYTDSALPKAPVVAVAAPTANSILYGTARLTAAAGDDGKLTQVDFLVNGNVVGSDTTAPYEFDYATNTIANGAWNVTARATDDAGHVTTSAAVPITVHNAALPWIGVVGPQAGATVSGGAVPMIAALSDVTSVAAVEFYSDSLLIASDTTAPYQVSWNTLDPAQPMYDGTHQLTARAVLVNGRTVDSLAVGVTVANTAGTVYKAGFDLGAPGPADDTIALPPVTPDNNTLVPLDDVLGAAGTSTLPATPSTSYPVLPPPDPVVGRILPVDDDYVTNAFPATVAVSNTSTVTWPTAGTLQLWYRWYTPDGVVIYEGKSSNLPALTPGTSTTVPASVSPPATPLGSQTGEIRLRFDVYNTSTGAWFAGKGNKPVDNPVIVNKNLENALGLERFWQYDVDDAGAGMSTLTNVANGNMLLRWSPFMAPGRGLATLVDLTYNSLEDHSRSPAGNNFSLNMSGLTRFGEPLDLRPPHTVMFTDGDGTTHQFDKVTGTDGIARWIEPPGVNLYLREVPTNPTTRRWGLTRPDSVTFWFDDAGFPTAVVDRNGNTMTFVLEDTPPGEDPGGPKKRIIRVTDPGGRFFVVDYYSKDEAKKAHVRGNIQRIIDHSGSVLDFEYYEDGNLRRLIQRGGLAANGRALADRWFVFTYTTSNGAGPAIPLAADRVDPDPRTPNQSTRVFSVRDPRGAETLYDYYSASEGAQLRWKLQSRTDRAGTVTSYTYNLTSQITTVSAPLSRVTNYTYDTDGKVTQIVNALSQTSTVEWSPDFKVTKVTEPTGRFVTYSYNSNGYLLSETNQATERTELTYVDTAVDANDNAAHLSLLSTVTKPRGTATPAVPNDYQWRYSYDTAGNIDKVTDPMGAVTDYDYNLAGSPAPGTVASIRDANGNAPTTFPTYDLSGQPTEMRDPMGGITRFGFTADGHVQYIQDPNHAGDTGADVRSYRMYFDYDAFHRLGRQSAPKSTAADRGRLIWSGVEFDANDNVVRRLDPHYGLGDADPENGFVSTATYDVMDRVTLNTGPDTSADPAGERIAFAYDAAGRMIKQTKPKGVQSSTVDDFAVVFAYDVLDRLSKQTTYGANTSEARHAHFCYDVAGDLRSVTSPRANLPSVTCPGNGPATVAFTQKYEYDLAHRQTRLIDPLGHASRTGYDANGNATLQERDIETGRVQRTTVEHDMRDLPFRVTEAVNAAASQSAVTQISYDGNGNRSKIVSPRGTDFANGGTPVNYVTSFTYDGLNRLTMVTLPFDSDDGANRQYVHRKYDANGNTEWTSLPVNTPTASSVQDTARTVMEYFDPGWVRTSKDPRNPKVRFDYAAQGWQILRQREKPPPSPPGVVDPDRQIGWTYYPDGQLQERKDFKGQPSTFKYDANNNLTEATDAAGLVDPGEKAVETRATYTGFDEILKVRHRRQGDTNWKFNTYTYDQNGNTTIRLENGEETDAGAQVTAPRRHELTYDANDWLATQLDLGTDSACKGDQRIVNQFFDNGLEKQREIFRAATGCVADPLTWPQKQRTNWTHTDNGKMSTLTTRNGSGTITESHNVSYYDIAGDYINGNRTKDTFTLRRAQGNTTTTCVGTPCVAEYNYDARDRLTRHQKRAGKVTTYKFDEPAMLIGDTSIRAGHITTENNDKGQQIIRRYQSDQNVEMSVGPVTAKLWYDNDGNTDCITLSGGTQTNDCNRPDGGGTANLITDYSYDYLSRMEGIQQYSGGSSTDKTTYTYDALDRTSKEQEDHNGTGKDRTTTFTYQGLSKLATEEKQAGGTNPKTKQFSYDQFGHRVAFTDKDNATGAENQYSYSTDVHGSVSQLLDDAGQVKASYGYDAYGGTDAPSTDPDSLTTGDTDQQAPINPYRYSGRRMDSGTASSTVPPVPVGSASYDMGARRFGPDLGRFFQQDMFAGAIADLGLALDPLTQNRYALAGGNPISFVEYDGHFPSLSDIGDAIKEGIDKAADAIGDAVSSASDTVRSAFGSGSGSGNTSSRGGSPPQRSNPVRDFLNSDAGEVIREGAKHITKAIDGVYGLVDNVKTISSLAGHALRDKKLPDAINSWGGRWLRNVAQNPTYRKALKFTNSTLGKGIKRGAAVLSFGLDVAENYASGDKALPAVTKAAIPAGTAIAGGKIGATAGAAIGTAIAPGPGTVIGGAIGGLAGGIAGGIGGEKLVEEFEEPIDDAAGAVQDFAGDVAGDVGDALGF